MSLASFKSTISFSGPDFSSDSASYTDEFSLSISPSKPENEIPEELLKGAANSLKGDCAHPKHSDGQNCIEIPKLQSSSQWADKLQRLRKQANGSSTMEQIYFQINEVFVNRLFDLENNVGAQDLEIMVQTYKDWTDVLRRFNTFIFEDLDQLENAVLNFFQTVQSISFLASSHRDLAFLLKLLADASKKKEWNWSEMIFETLKSTDVVENNYSNALQKDFW